MSVVTTDHEKSQSEQRTVNNKLDGSVNGAVVLAGSIDRVSFVGSAAHVPASSEEHLRQLATASLNQWTAAANDRRLRHPAPLPMRWRRSCASVAGPVSAARYPRFDPLPGLTAVSDSELRAGNQDELHRIYGGLPSGRLLLMGPPGSGKSAAAVLLLLDALHYRERARLDEQARIPVPVLFTLHGWNPDSGESVTDWMAGKLAETYPMFRSRAGRRAATDLLTAGRVAGFLDGLDEIPESVRPGVLEALADAPFRLVLLTRTEEAVKAARQSSLAGAVAVELRPVTSTDAAGYLLQRLVDPPPASWQTICDHLAGLADDHQRTSPLAQALTTPLTLTLLRDVYGQTGPVDELLSTARFRTAADIENHLLDHAITAAYTPRPGHSRPRYSVATADRTLRYLATRLTEQHTTDLAWWHIPTWTPHRSRIIVGVVANLLANEVLFGLGLAFSVGFGLGLTVGLVFGLMTLLGYWVAGVAEQWRGMPVMPQRIVRFTYRGTLPNFVVGFASGLTGGLLAGLAAGLVSGLSAGLAAGIPIGLASGLASVAMLGIARHTDLDATSPEPAAVWRNDRNAGLVHIPTATIAVALLAALTATLVPGLASGLASRPWVVLAAVLLVGLVLGLGCVAVAKRMGLDTSSPGSAAIDTAGALAQLAIRHKIPLRLIAFLEDARSRHLLRTMGPVYQFRHATLQDRLAAPHPDTATGLNL
jgi:hypothetical protein